MSPRGGWLAAGAAGLAYLALTCAPAVRGSAGPAPAPVAPPAAASGTPEARDASLDAEAGRSLPEAEIDAAVANAMAAGAIPGAVVVIGRRAGVLFRRAYGLRELEPERAAMTVDTLFDLASLTKPVATATSVMALVERGDVRLDDPISKYVAACNRADKRAITVRDLLLHVSGLPADTRKDDFAHGRDEALRRICDTRLRAAPGAGSIYSDLGFMLLEEVVRHAAGQSLDAFAAATIFAPLGMKDTGFSPPPELRARAASTENVDGVWRVGVVHDPRAYLLGGVAGHAGLFSTGDDLARYARALLGGGALDGHRFLSARGVATMLAPHDVPGAIRALGWNVTSTWRGAGLSPRAVGHFGFTGTALWIDPEKDLFVVVLTNRVHPDGQGDSKPLVARIDALAAQAVGPAVGRAVVCDEAGGALTGIDVLRAEGFERLAGKTVGLVTNVTGRARDGTSTIDLLRGAPRVKLAALLTPEHGLAADRQGKVDSGRDDATGLPVISLYGDALAPTAEALAGLDALVFDLQDVGTRFFTYASTMRRAMEAARDHELEFFVLDRPDPIDGVDVAGPVLVPPSRSFVNYHSLPIRHGMTVGELALLLDADDGLGVALSVVPMRGWRRSDYWEATGLPWVNPSPNLHGVDEALLYPAIGLLEATNLSVGRGTDAPFERVGAPWIDGPALLAALGALPGAEFAVESFTPVADKYAGVACHGLRLRVVDRAAFEPVQSGLAIARALHRLYPQTWEVAKLDRLLVHPEAIRAIEAGQPLSAVVATYRAELAAFVAKREKYLLYDPCPPPAAPTMTGPPTSP